MSEEMEGSDQQGTVNPDEDKTKIILELSKDTLVRFKRKAKQDLISMSSFLRNSVEKYLEEDERIEFLVEESEFRGAWKNWKKYRDEQKEEDIKEFEEFTRDEVEDIFKEIREIDDGQM